jgi:Zn-dependent protease
MVVSWLVSRSTPFPAPGYTFLEEVNSGLQSQVVLLQQGSFQEVQQQLEQDSSDSLERHWTFDATSALAMLEANDLDAALEDFRNAAEKNPERSEFYYYYGVALLEDGQEKNAAEQFRRALAHEPHLEGAERYANLLQSTYTPSQWLSGLMYIFILLILFTLHEYGHAFAAWKLGDDTAQKQGRLSLNPIPHLDLFGSIILPAILLFQQSEFVFGWARPVPVDSRNFKDPRKDHMLVAFAGPAVNLLIAMLSLVLLSAIMLLVRLFWPETMTLNLSTPFSSISLAGPPFSRWLIFLVLFLKQLFYTSLVLGCFNLLPIPPLDGSWIFSGWLPQGLHNVYEKTRQFGFVIFILLVVTSVLDYILLIPITLSWGALQLLVSAMGLG